MWAENLKNWRYCEACQVLWRSDTEAICFGCGTWTPMNAGSPSFSNPAHTRYGDEPMGWR